MTWHRSTTRTLTGRNLTGQSAVTQDNARNIETQRTLERHKTWNGMARRNPASRDWAHRSKTSPDNTQQRKETATGRRRARPGRAVYDAARTRPSNTTQGASLDAARLGAAPLDMSLLDSARRHSAQQDSTRPHKSRN